MGPVLHWIHSFFLNILFLWWNSKCILRGLVRNLLWHWDETMNSSRHSRTCFVDDGRSFWTQLLFQRCRVGKSAWTIGFLARISVFHSQRKKKSGFSGFELSESEKSKVPMMTLSAKLQQNWARGVKLKRFSRIQVILSSLEMEWGKKCVHSFLAIYAK